MQKGAYLLEHPLSEQSMGLFIRDDAVRDMAKRLAAARHTTVTEAVRKALEREIADLERDLKDRDRRIRESWARVDAMPRRDYDDEDMYDEFGNPR
jgi:hypothetical protein